MSKFEPNSQILKLTEGAQREVEGFAYSDLRQGGPLTFKTPILRAEAPDSTRFHVDSVLQEILDSDESAEAELEGRVAARLAEVQAAAEEEARRRGHEAGFEAGRGEALAQYQVDAQEKLAQLDAFIANVESHKNHLYKAQERFLLEVIQRMAEAVIHREVATDKEYLLRLVHDVIENVGAKEQIKILVNPGALEMVYAVIPELEKKYATLKSISVEPNAQLELTDCAIETDWNRVDATLATQMESLKQALLSGHQGV